MMWARFIGAWAKSHNVSLKTAMKDPKCKADYEKQKTKK